MNDWDDNERIEGGALGARFDDDFGQAIGAALGDLRVAPSDFAAGVAKRIEEGEEKIRKSGPGRVLSIGWLRQAASFLPPFLVPRALAEAALTAGGVAVKKGAWAWLPGVLALPVLLFSMLIGSFVWGVRRVGDVRDQGVVEDLAGYQVRQWWKAHRLMSFVLPILLLYFGSKAPLEAVTFFVIVAIVVQLGIFKALAEIGLASRAEIGQRCGEFLLSTVIWAYLMMIVWVQVGDGMGVRATLVFVPILGGAVCLRLASLDRLGWPMRYKQRVVLPVLGSTVFGLSILASAGSIRATRADALQWVEAGLLDAEQFGHQGPTLVATFEHLVGQDGEVPDATVFREQLSAHLQGLRDLKPERDNDYRALRECAALGWLTSEDIALFADAREEERLTTGSHPMGSTGDVYMAVRNRMQAGSLSATERSEIGRRVIAGVSEEVNLERLWCAVRVLEALELPGRVEELSGVVQLALQRTWTGTAASDVGCFAPNASYVQRTSYGSPLPDQAPKSWLGFSDWALRLMGRFGVPRGVDLDSFARYLRTGRLRPRLTGDVPRTSLAAAMGTRVQRLAGRQESGDQTTLWTQLAELRAVLAVLLLTAFCIVLTARAPLTAIEDC